jgi:hypothetical protein
MNVVRRQLVIGQLVFCGLLICCSFVMPSVVSSEGGVSNFGNHWSTLPMYALAFSVVIVMCLCAAAQLARIASRLRYQVWTLRALALLYFLVFCSTFPRRVAMVWSQVHDGLGIVLVAFETVIALFLLVRKRRPLLVLSVVVQCVGAVIALFSVLKVDHLLFIGQSVEALGFAGVLSVGLPASVLDHLRQK